MPSLSHASPKIGTGPGVLRIKRPMLACRIRCKCFLRNHCNIFWVDAGIHSKMRSTWCISFPSVFGVDTCINPKNITTIPYHFISTLLNVNFDFDVTVANDVAIDVAKCSLPDKVMQWSPCLEVPTLTNENRRYMIKLNDMEISYNSVKRVKFGNKVDISNRVKNWCNVWSMEGVTVFGPSSRMSCNIRERGTPYCLIRSPYRP